jgi:predicted nucleic acid-binding protein
MGQGFLIDTNVIIDVLDNLLPPNGMAFVAHQPPVISQATRMELLGWRNATPSQLAPVQAFVNNSTLLPIDEPVILQVIFIRQTKKIKLGDAIIAATALVYNLDLISRNTSDFKDIQGLTVIDPYVI